MKRDKYFTSFISYFEEILCSLFILVMVVLVICNVFMRYIFDFSISWAEEVATICFVWCVFIGASAGYKHKMDVGITLVIDKLPSHLQPFISLLTRLLLLVLNAYIFYMAIVFTRIAWVKPTAVLGVSSAVFNLALVVGFGLITFYTLLFFYQDLIKFKHKVGGI